MPFRGTPYWAMSTEIRNKVCKKLSDGRIGKDNPNWKGALVGYFGLHGWAKRWIEKTLLCQRCHLQEPRDLANKSGKYKRDVKDWWWLCRRCHMITDGRLLRFLKLGKEYQYRKKRKAIKQCDA